MATPDDLDSDEFADLDETSDLNGLENIPIEDDAAELEDLDVDDDNDEAAPAGDDEDDAQEAVEEEDAHEDLDDDEDPDGQEESLDVILAREQDLEDEFAPAGSARGTPTSTPPGEDEFTCRSCFLVKRRAQLADSDELICLDCA